MKIIFLNPVQLDIYRAKAEKIAADWNYPRDQFFQVYSMVATIELGMTDRCFYFTGSDGREGIIFEGWNGYRHMAADKADPNPYSAYNGFYRMEKNQMVGWSCWLIHLKSKEGTDRALIQASHCGSVYGYFFEYEPEPRVWGWYNWQEFYTEADAIEALRPYQDQPYVKRYSIEYSDMSGMWRIQIETTRKKTNLKNVGKRRVAA